MSKVISLENLLSDINYLEDNDYIIFKIENLTFEQIKQAIKKTFCIVFKFNGATYF